MQTAGPTSYIAGMLPAAPPVDPPPAIPADETHGSVPERYLALLADVAERLLAAACPASMVDGLFDLIRRELRLDVFFNYRSEGDRLILEAHGGLTEQEVRDGAELRVGQAVCGCVARDRKPVHAISVQTSDDPLHAFVKGMGLDAYACTPLLHGDQLLGTLGFGRRWSDRFTMDELRFLHTVCHYVALAKYRLQVEAALRDGVAARERLLAELNHRVRNALQVAIGLVAMELPDADAAARPALQRAVDRLQVLALAHRPLYTDGRTHTIDVRRLLTDVLEGSGLHVRFDGLADARSIPVETAAALALLVHMLTAGASALTLDVDVADDRLRLRFSQAAAGVGRDPVPAGRTTDALLRQLRADLRRDGPDLLLTLPCPITGDHD